MPDPGYQPDWMLFSLLFGLVITVVGWLVERIKTRGERKRMRELIARGRRSAAEDAARDRNV